MMQEGIRKSEVSVVQCKGGTERSGEKGTGVVVPSLPSCSFAAHFSSPLTRLYPALRCFRLKQEHSSYTTMQDKRVELERCRTKKKKRGRKRDWLGTGMVCACLCCISTRHFPVDLVFSHLSPPYIPSRSTCLSFFLSFVRVLCTYVYRSVVSLVWWVVLDPFHLTLPFCSLPVPSRAFFFFFPLLSSLFLSLSLLYC